VRERGLRAQTGNGQRGAVRLRRAIAVGVVGIGLRGAARVVVARIGARRDRALRGQQPGVEIAVGFRRARVRGVREARKLAREIEGVGVDVTPEIGFANLTAGKATYNNGLVVFRNPDTPSPLPPGDAGKLSCGSAIA
jgi:hypothetical protein